jgi:hypothetical protein
MSNGDGNQVGPGNWGHLFEELRQSHRTVDGLVDLHEKLEEVRLSAHELEPRDVEVTVSVGLVAVKFGPEVLAFADTEALLASMSLELNRALILAIADLHNIVTLLQGGAAQLELQIHAAEAALVDAAATQAEAGQTGA